MTEGFGVDRYEFNRQLAEAARAMAEEKDTASTLERAVQMATDLIANADVAGLWPVHPGGIDTPAASHEDLSGSTSCSTNSTKAPACGPSDKPRS